MRVEEEERGHDGEDTGDMRNEEKEKTPVVRGLHWWCLVEEE
jgi:hypothetical protein